MGSVLPRMLASTQPGLSSLRKVTSIGGLREKKKKRLQEFCDSVNSYVGDLRGNILRKNNTEFQEINRLSQLPCECQDRKDSV